MGHVTGHSVRGWPWGRAGGVRGCRPGASPAQRGPVHRHSAPRPHIRHRSASTKNNDDIGNDFQLIISLLENRETRFVVIFFSLTKPVKLKLKSPGKTYSSFSSFKKRFIKTRLRQNFEIVWVNPSSEITVAKNKVHLTIVVKIILVFCSFSFQSNFLKTLNSYKAPLFSCPTGNNSHLSTSR